MGVRSRSPVFVVGSARSGTTLLYHTILSAGDFAVFRAETHAYDVLGPRFGHFRTEHMRRQFMAEWLRTRHFELSRLNASELTERVVRDCRSTGDFLRLFMGMIAAAQGAHRWAECTPAHLYHMPRIKQEIPDARFLHIIRDGRDVALSAGRLGWVRALPGDRTPPRVLAALAWNWGVRRGRRLGRELADAYQEVRFEELVHQPEPVLGRIADFIGQPLDLAQIRSVGIGSVSQPNTSFGSGAEPFDPIGRFRTKLSAQEVADLEFLIGDLLDELGYLRSSGTAPRARSRLAVKRALYGRYFATKEWTRVHTPLGRRTSLESLNSW